MSSCHRSVSCCHLHREARLERRVHDSVCITRQACKRFRFGLQWTSSCYVLGARHCRKHSSQQFDLHFSFCVIFVTSGTHSAPFVLHSRCTIVSRLHFPYHLCFSFAVFFSVGDAFASLCISLHCCFTCVSLVSRLSFDLLFSSASRLSTE